MPDRAYTARTTAGRLMASRRSLLLACLIAPTVARSAQPAVVRIDNFTFAPATLTIAQGTEVTWTNADDIPHSIVLASLGVHSRAMDTDERFTYRFEQAGTFDYLCGLHPHMRGVVVVR